MSGAILVLAFISNIILTRTSINDNHPFRKALNLSGLHQAGEMFEGTVIGSFRIGGESTRWQFTVAQVEADALTADTFA
jgi:hypothetical protein